MVVFAPELSCPEDIRQMIASGNRSLGGYEGYVFCNGNPEAAASLRHRCLENIGPDYGKGAMLLSVLRVFGPM